MPWELMWPHLQRPHGAAYTHTGTYRPRMKSTRGYYGIIAPNRRTPDFRTSITSLCNLCGVRGMGNMEKILRCLVAVGGTTQSENALTRRLKHAQFGECRCLTHRSRNTTRRTKQSRFQSAPQALTVHIMIQVVSSTWASQQARPPRGLVHTM